MRNFSGAAIAAAAMSVQNARRPRPDMESDPLIYKAKEETEESDASKKAWFAMGVVAVVAVVAWVIFLIIF